MANPVLQKNFGDQAALDAGMTTTQGGIPGHAGPVVTERMSVGGVTTKTGGLLLLVLAAAAWGWSITNPLAGFPGWFLWLVLGAFGVAIVTVVRPQLAPFLAPVYAVLEGVLLGVISRVYEAAWDGIVIQAVLATMATFVGMLLLYATGVIKASPRFRKIVIGATVGIALFYLLSIGLSLFGVSMPYVWDGSPLGILISVAVIVVAALNLVLDFDFIDRGVEAGLPKAMEWLAAFGLMVTIVWLYLEFLRLFGRLNQR